MNQEYQDEHLEEIEIEAIGVEIDSQPIELFKIFKIANIVGSGGEAKHIISEGYVAVNGELETRKRRKVYDGDLIEFNQEFYLIICDNPAAEEPEHRSHEMDNPVVEPDAFNEPAEPEAEELQPAPKQEKQKSNPKKGRKSIQFF
ncbi:RNA-binding S4 domain-containing protein [Vibrio sp. JC009]|uniref:RNA-binding S4 domain-containing protein n=1 Tax=Vibrio sp. JC009 TaxID=2912314 RepID=UPI0023AFCC34|nr:RNA-binding S4 domain-containing protein [Vibrio sp. JC009]WED24524.1 RNA-binding S4 domain-containing protein [Vibrio sp. JC009]